MSEPDAAVEPQPPAPVPGVVLATVIVLSIGGATQVLIGLAGGRLSSGIGSPILYGALNVVFAYHLYRRRRWARIGVLVLCGYGAVLAAILIVHDPPSGLRAFAGPITYPILLFLPAARAWFAKSPRP